MRWGLQGTAAVTFPGSLIALGFDLGPGRGGLVLGLGSLALAVAIEITLLFAAHDTILGLARRLALALVLVASTVMVASGMVLMLQSPDVLLGLGLLMAGGGGLAGIALVRFIPRALKTPGYRPLDT
jgi:hypothetical protein